MSHHAYVMREQCHPYSRPSGTLQANWNRIQKLFRTLVEITAFLLATLSCLTALFLVA